MLYNLIYKHLGGILELSHKKALIIAFYLSKFDRIAYENLALGNMTKTHKKIGEILGVKPNTIKNMRDEFDAVLDNGRKGWWQKNLSKTRVQTIENFDNLEENSLKELVQDILRYPELEQEPELKEIVQTINEDGEDKRKNKYSFSSARAQTGQFAEIFFIDNHKQILSENLQLNNYECIDTRNHGCGYDFEITSGKVKKYIEIKGMSANNGGILFTDKEWSCALQHKLDYILIIIKNVNEKPKVEVIQNPASIFKPQKRIQQIVQINWFVDKL